MQPAQGGAGLVRGGLAQLHPLLNRGADALLAGGDDSWRQVIQHRRETAQRADLGDTTAHGARAKYSDCADSDVIWHHTCGGAGVWKCLSGPCPLPRTHTPVLPHSHTQMSGSCQSISLLPASRKAALILLKGRLPKKPERADSGEGCADSMIVWRLESISPTFLRA